VQPSPSPFPNPFGTGDPPSQAEPGSPASLSGWRGTLLGLGHRRAVALITLMSILVSILVTLAANLLAGNIQNLPLDLSIAFLVPLLVAPLVSHRAMGLLYEVEASRIQLHHLAIRDGLTHLYNRRFFMGRLDSEVERSWRTGRPLSVLMIDLDHFKAINDRYGHAAGDDVLERFARLLVRATRPYDLVARYGGEEFVALLPDASLEEAGVVAERIRMAIQGIRLSSPRGTEGSETRGTEGSETRVTASVGVSGLGPPGDDPAEMLERADRATYAAKAAGRNLTLCFPPGAAGPQSLPQGTADGTPGSHTLG